MGTIFYILGLIGGELHYEIMWLSLFFAAVIIITASLAVFYKDISILGYLLLTGLGLVSIILNPTLKDEKIFANNTNQKLHIQGEVIDVKEYPYQNQYIIKPNKESKIRSKITVEVAKDLEVARQGDEVVTVGQAMPHSFPRNPGAFNERSYLLIRGVSSKFKAEGFKIEGEGGKIKGAQRLREYYGRIFETVMPFEQAQIMKAMLLGDKLSLSKDIQELYKDIGIAHVLAISGLHISVIAGVLWWLLKKIGLNKTAQSLCVLGILWAYGALTGFSISVTRSIIMSSVVIIGDLIDEKPDGITYLSFAALILLLYNNLYLWDIGFQLSFVAVASIMLLTRFFQRLFSIPKQIRDYLAPIIAVTIGTTPIIAYYYYVITPVSMLANLLLIPLITLVVIIGFIAMLLAPISLLLGKTILGSAYYLLVVVEKLSRFILKIPLSTIIVGRPDFIELLAYALGLGLVIWYLHKGLEERKRSLGYIVSMGLLVILIVGIKRVMPGDLRVTFLDVGQGDSIVITTPNHKTFIIDGGIAGNGRTIEGFLKYNGIRKIHGAILSHAHADHMDGLGELAQSYKIERLFLSELPFEDVQFEKFYAIMQSEDIPVVKIKAKDMIRDKDLEMECLYPFQDSSPLEGNDASVILVLKHGLVSYYFTGDIEQNYEKEVAQVVEKNKINILKVPHHGSKTSSTQEFITKVSPDLAIISCGKNNLYKHPHPEVLDRYRANNVPIKITKDSGAIMTYSNKKNVKIYLMEDKRMLWK